MHRSRPVRVVQLSLALLLAACATPPAPTPATTPAQRVEQADRLIHSHDYRGADQLLRSVIESADFAMLDPEHSHQALLLGGRIALQLEDRQRALSLFRRACESQQAGPDDWFMRVWVDAEVNDSADAAAALVTLTTRWPEALQRFESSGDFGKTALGYAVGALLRSGSDADRYSVLSALQKLRFAQEPSAAGVWWRELALMQLERGDSTAAVATLARMTNAYIGIAIDADKRFDPIRREISAQLDVSALAKRQIAAARLAADGNPSSLASTYLLVFLLRHSLRFDEALQLTDNVIARQQSQGWMVYDDYRSEYHWILNDRAYALFELGRWDEAASQMEAASRVSENGESNVSQTLNLALMYAGLGRPAEAMAALERVGRASFYGDMVGQEARFAAAVQLHDTKTADDALKYLSDHREDSLGGYQEALLIADQADEGAKLLISRLEDPRLRSGALAAVQEYGEENLPPELALRERRWHALLARSDVQEAIRRVGCVKRYPLLRGNY